MRHRICVCKCGSGHVVGALPYDSETMDIEPAAALGAEMDFQILGGTQSAHCEICGDRQRRFCLLDVQCLSMEDAKRNAHSMLERQREARALSAEFLARMAGRQHKAPIAPIND